MRSLRTPLTVFAASSLALVAACDLQPFSIHDGFAAVDKDDPDDSLHAYASNARVPMTLRAHALGLDADDARISIVPVEGNAEAGIDGVETGDDDELRFTLITHDAGSILLHAEVGSHARDVTIEVVDVDALELAVTAPDRIGDLPVVDPTAIRIYAGGSAAFRTTLKKDGNEVFGLDAVAALVADARLKPDNASGCAADTCDAVRNAMRLDVDASADAPIDVTLVAGDAIVDVRVLPTPDAEVTAVALENTPSTSGGDDKEALWAHVLAGTDPVFGAPVQWSVDGAVLIDDDGAAEHGDLLEFVIGDRERDVVASLGGRNIPTTVRGEDFEVTSITGSCASLAGAWPSLFALALLLGARRMRRLHACTRSTS